MFKIFVYTIFAFIQKGPAVNSFEPFPAPYGLTKKIKMQVPWHKLTCSRKELQLLGTLNGGQSFRWKMNKANDKERWIGVFGRRVWILEQNDDHISYQVHQQSKSDGHHEDGLRSYFQLSFDLKELYAKWSEDDPYFKEAARQFYGIRILKQDPVENIFSFICSSNNNISRISSMVEKLAAFYGERICEIDGVDYYSFPEVKRLAESGVENKLRTNGFGYRAKYIAKSAQKIVENGGDVWIEKLRAMDYKEAKSELMTLTGIGAKVADCICLMSLGHLQCVPVDTHIYQIAARLYLPNLPKQKTVTEKVYNQIGDHFRKIYGPLAGWAHTVLFCADLKKFSSREKQESEPAPSSKKMKTK